MNHYNRKKATLSPKESQLDRHKILIWKECHAVTITLEIKSDIRSLNHVNICTIQFIFIDIIKHIYVLNNIVGVTSKDRIAGGWS